MELDHQKNDQKEQEQEQEHTRTLKNHMQRLGTHKQEEQEDAFKYRWMYI